MRPFKLFALMICLALGATSCRYLETAAAVVDGKAITMHQLDQLISSKLQKGAADTQKLDAERRELGQLIQNRIISSEAERRHIVVSNADVEDRFRRIRSGFPSEAAFQQALSQQGIDPSSIKDRIKLRLIVDQIQKSLSAASKVTDEEIKAAYGTGAQFESVHVRHILFAAHAPADYPKALKKAQAALKLLRSGTSFAALAAKMSDDPGSKTRGGDIGDIQRGRTVPEFEAVAFKLKPGQISNPVRTQFGYHLIQVVKKNSKTFKQAEAGLREQIQQQKSQAAFSKFLTERVKAADVRINPKLGTFDAATLSVVDRRFFSPGSSTNLGRGPALPVGPGAPIPVQS